jgi:hypothetical protein
MIEFADGREASDTHTLVSGSATLTGAHQGGVVIVEGGHLLIRGHLTGSIFVREGGHLTIAGTVTGTVVNQNATADGSCIVEESGRLEGLSDGPILVLGYAAHSAR